MTEANPITEQTAEANASPTQDAPVVADAPATDAQVAQMETDGAPATATEPVVEPAIETPVEASGDLSDETTILTDHVGDLPVPANILPDTLNGTVMSTITVPLPIEPVDGYAPTSTAITLTGDQAITLQRVGQALRLRGENASDPGHIIGWILDQIAR